MAGTTMTRPWAEIEQTYAKCTAQGAELDHMVELVQKIRASPFAPYVYAWTSMHDLCIAQRPVLYPYDSAYLRISPRPSGKLEFCFVDTPVARDVWRRIVDGEAAFDRLERFFFQIHWFYPESGSDLRLAAPAPTRG